MKALYTINDKMYRDNIYQSRMVRKNMEIIVIGIIASAVAAGVMPLQSVMPKLFP
jgi:hypothetical protein